jgi:hypothetical protein
MVMQSSQPKDPKSKAASSRRTPKSEAAANAELQTRTAIRGGFSKFYAFTLGGVQAYDALGLGEKLALQSPARGLPS